MTIKTEQIKKFLDRRKTYNFIFHEYNLLFLSGMFVIIFYLLNNSGSISSIPELWIGVGSIVLSMFLVSKLREIYPLLQIEVKTPRESTAKKIFKSIILPLIITIAGGIALNLYYIKLR